MTYDEAKALLGLVQAYDNRKVGQVTISAWHAALEDVPFEAAKLAVIEHFRTSALWLMPAHVRAIAAPPADELDAIEAVELDAKQRWLAAAGVSLDEYNARVLELGVVEACAFVETRVRAGYDSSPSSLSGGA